MSAIFLAEQELESTEFDTAVGTIGGGNHFAELQAVEKILDAEAFKTLNLGKEQLVVVVHSGSRGLGEAILRAHVDQHFGEGVEAESFAAADHLRGHDFAVRWAKANRQLIARRFVATLGAEAECLWDGCHNSITPLPLPLVGTSSTSSPLSSGKLIKDAVERVPSALESERALEGESPSAAVLPAASRK